MAYLQTQPPPNIPVRITRNYAEPLLEIKNLNQPAAVKEEAAAASFIKASETAAVATVIAYDEPYRSTNITEPSAYKSALDFMPKFVLKQINERRLLNTNALNTINNSVLNNAVLISPYYSKSTSDLIENVHRDLILKKASSKLNKVPQPPSTSNSSPPATLLAPNSTVTTTAANPLPSAVNISTFLNATNTSHMISNNSKAAVKFVPNKRS